MVASFPFTRLLPAILVVAPALIGPGPVSASEPAPVVVPSIQQWVGDRGEFVLGPGSRIVAERAELLPDARVFAADVATITGFVPAVVTGRPSRGDIVVGLDLAIGYRDGYRLVIGDTVRVSGASVQGAFYGTQTVEQLLVRGRLPRGVATDWPAIGHRGVMLDLGRHYYSVDYVLDQIRQAAWTKLNVVHLHFTEENAFRLQSTTYPGLAAPQSYSHADIRRFVDQARRYHVTLLPEIDLPGHSVPIGQFKPELQWDCPSMNGSAYRHWPGYTLDITKPATTDLVTDLLKEFVPLFPDSPVFHLGGDEYPKLPDQLQCPELVSYAATHGYRSTEDVFVDWLNRTARMVSGLGKRPEIWNWWDVAGGATVQPDKNIIVNAWTGNADAYLAAGYDTVSSPGDLLYVTPYGPPGRPSVDDVSLYRDWTPQADPHLLGYEVSRWSDNAVTQPDAYFDWFAQRPQQVLADRVWGGARAFGSVQAFEDAADRIGTAPGVPQQSAPEDVPLSGKPYGTSPAYGGSSNTFDKAFDGDPDTFFDYAEADGGYTGIDLGRAVPVTSIRFVPRSAQPSRMVGGRFEGCTDGPDQGCHVLATVRWTPSPDWHQLVTDPVPYRWLRYVGPPGGFTNVAEIQFFTGGTQFSSLSTSDAWEPGGRYPVTGSYTNTSASTVDVSLTAASVDNDTRLQVIGKTCTVAPGRTIPLTWQVSVPVTAPAGKYRLTAHAGGKADTTTTILVPFRKLTFDNTGITDDRNPQPPELLSGFDNYEGTFSAQALAAAGVTPGGTVVRGGLKFTWPSGRPDNVIAAGQTIDLHGTGGTLGFLASAGFGPAGGTGTVTYTDGSSQPFTISAPDWTSIPPDANVAISTPYHNLPAGPVPAASAIYLVTASIDPAKTVARVTLPVATGNSPLSTLHIFAVAVG